jgi:hypothetical protein
MVLSVRSLWPARVIDYDESGALVVRVGEGFLLSWPLRPYEDDPTLHFLVTAHGCWGSVRTTVETWGGDGLDTFPPLSPKTFVAGKGSARGTRSATT